METEDYFKVETEDYFFVIIVGLITTYFIFTNVVKPLYRSALPFQKNAAQYAQKTVL